MDEFNTTAAEQPFEQSAEQGASEQAGAKSKFEDAVRAVADDVTEALDKAVDGAADFLSGQNGNKLLGGAAVGALAAIVLPVSLVGGALLGAGYAAYRQSNK